jgi:hypothetical protein
VRARGANGSTNAEPIHARHLDAVRSPGPRAAEMGDPTATTGARASGVAVVRETIDRAISRARSEIGNLVAPENGESHMALAPCREYGREVSTEAATCPPCGVGRRARQIATPSLPNYPSPDPKKRSSLKTAFLVGIGISIVIAFLQSAVGDGPASVVRTATAVSFVPGVVRLDWAAGEMEIRGRIAKPPGALPEESRNKALWSRCLIFGSLAAQRSRRARR